MQSKLKTDPKLDWGTIVMNTFASYPVSMWFDMNTSWEWIKKLAWDAWGWLLDFMSDKVAPAWGKILESLVWGFVWGLSWILDRVDRHLMNDDDWSEQTTEEKQKEIEEIRNRNNKTK
jgi:hypothetical protein